MVAFVVMSTSSMPGTSDSMRTRSTTQRRASGSPPVTRTLRTPSVAAAATMSVSSSNVSRSRCARAGTPAAGMQYTQRQLHLSVTDRRR